MFNIIRKTDGGHSEQPNGKPEIMKAEDEEVDQYAYGKYDAPTSQRNIGMAASQVRLIYNIEPVSNFKINQFQYKQYGNYN
jgi:hypothetical protein